MYYTSIELENNTLNLKKALSCCLLLGVPTAVTLQGPGKVYVFIWGNQVETMGLLLVATRHVVSLIIIAIGVTTPNYHD